MYLSMYLLRLRRVTKMTNESAPMEHMVDVNGTIKNPIDRDPFLIKFELVVSIVGILMNVSIVCIIIFNNHLCTKPRNIFLLGLVLSNLSASVPVLMAFSYLISPSQELCQMYIAIVGLPHALFLTNLLLALVDRYAAIVHPLWHKEKVTVRLAVFSQLGASIFISIIYKFAYITQFIPLNCVFRLIQLKIVALILLILFLSCILLQIIVYRRTRKILGNCGKIKRGRTETTESRVSTIFPVIISNLVIHQRITPSIPSLPIGELASTPELLNVHISDSSINRLEIEATTTLVASVTSLSVLTSPAILLPFAMSICRLYSGNHVCSFISWLAPYFKVLVVLHVVYHPTFYFLRSSELSSVLKKLFKR